MAKYSFSDDIRNPDREGPNPFEDDHKDEHPAEGNDVFSSGSQSAVYNPVYETSYADRATLTLVLAVTGCLLSLSGWLGYVYPVGFTVMLYLSIALTLPAVTMSRTDLAGMDAGAVSSVRKNRSFASLLLGFVGLANTMIYALVQIYSWLQLF